MFLSKLALYGSIAGTFFAVSAFSTIQISKYMNKTPIPNETEEEEDDLYVREMSDTERFINELTNFGNMEGNLNINITKGAYKASIKGDVFVSMESLDDVQVDAKLVFNINNRDFNINATYLNNTIYATLEGNNMKMETSSINDITSTISSINGSVKLPSTFENIDTDKLLDNLAAMTAEKDDNNITYTCNLLDNVPPLIFTSDLNYKMTSLKISDFEIEGFKIDAYATTNILGKGHNRIVVPENANNPYINLSNTITNSKDGLVNQISNLLNKKEIGISNYNIDVYKGGNTLDKLVFSMNGEANISLPNVNDISSCQVSLSGNMLNPNQGKELDSNVDIKLYEGSVYFDYNNELKLKYSVDDIKGLVEIIKSKINNNSTTDIASILDKIFPTSSETKPSPIVNIIKDKNYLDILDYYLRTTVDGDTHTISVIFDGTLIGNNDAEIALSFKTGSKGITNISINGLYALGYTLDCSFDLDAYKSFTMNEDEMDSYTNLGYINNIFDQVFALVHKDQFALSLNGTVNLGKGDLSINGNSYVSLSENNDFGVADLIINDNKNSHHIKLDVNRNKVDKDASEEEKKLALETSEILFSYNDNLKGYLNLNSVKETIDLIKELSSDGNPLLERIQALMSKDTTQTTINKILEGEPEAILYDNSLEAITYGDDANGHYYDIQINGNLLKSNESDTAESIHLYINLDNDNNFIGLGIKASLNSYSFDIDLGISEASENTINWNRLVKNSSYYDFSELKTLTEYLFNTATNKNFHIEGTVDVSLLSPFDIIVDINISEEGETVAKVQFKDIPYFIGLTSISRNSTIYVVEKKVNGEMNRDIYIETTHKDHLLSSKKTDRVKLTTEEFTNNIVYYLVNYTLGLTIDVSSASGSSNNNIDYSSILKGFNYSTKNNIPTWDLTLDVGELAGTSALNDANVKISGTDINGSRYLNHITASLGIISILSADIDATITSFEYDAVKVGYESAINYATAHASDSYNYK